MDATLAQIEQKLRSLEQELDAFPEFRQWRELAAFKAKHLEYIQEKQRLLGGDELPGGETVTSSIQAVRDTKEEGVPTNKTTPTVLIIQNTRKIIEEVGKPVPISAIYNELVKRGIEIGGENPRANLSAKLSNAKKELYNAKPLGWWLPERASELSEKHEGLLNGAVGRPS
jgi:hypothetical protein